MLEDIFSIRGVTIVGIVLVLIPIAPSFFSRFTNKFVIFGQDCIEILNYSPGNISKIKALRCITNYNCNYVSLAKSNMLDRDFIKSKGGLSQVVSAGGTELWEVIKTAKKALGLS